MSNENTESNNLNLTPSQGLGVVVAGTAVSFTAIKTMSSLWNRLTGRQSPPPQGQGAQAASNSLANGFGNFDAFVYPFPDHVNKSKADQNLKWQNKYKNEFKIEHVIYGENWDRIANRISNLDFFSGNDVYGLVNDAHGAVDILNAYIADVVSTGHSRYSSKYMSSSLRHTRQNYKVIENMFRTWLDRRDLAHEFRSHDDEFHIRSQENLRLENQVRIWFSETSSDSSSVSTSSSSSQVSASDSSSVTNANEVQTNALVHDEPTNLNVQNTRPVTTGPASLGLPSRPEPLTFPTRPEPPTLPLRPEPPTLPTRPEPPALPTQPEPSTLPARPEPSTVPTHPVATPPNSSNVPTHQATTHPESAGYAFRPRQNVDEISVISPPSSAARGRGNSGRGRGNGRNFPSPRDRLYMDDSVNFSDPAAPNRAHRNPRLDRSRSIPQSRRSERDDLVHTVRNFTSQNSSHNNSRFSSPISSIPPRSQRGPSQNRTVAFDLDAQNRSTHDQFGNPSCPVSHNTNTSFAFGQPMYTLPNTSHQNRSQIVPNLNQTGVNPADFDADHDFYLSLPPPWNQLPLRKKMSDHWKSVNEECLKFNGCVSDYPVWRNYFITNVHTVELSMAQKATKLYFAIKNVSRLKALVDGVNYNSIGYKTFICALEERYGGPKRMLSTCKEKLDNFPRVKFGDIEQLELLVDTAQAYISKMQCAGLMNEVHTFSFQELMEDKLSSGYETMYLDWLRTTDRPRNGLSVVDWCRSFYSDKVAGKEGDRLARKNEEEIRQKKSSFNRFSKKSFFTDDSKDKEDIPEGKDDEIDDDELAELGFLSTYPSSKSDKKKTIHVPSCFMCNGKHYLADCPVFLKKSPRERIKLLTKERCFKCFRLGHNHHDCPFDIECAKCSAAHNTLLHVDRSDKPESVKFCKDEESSKSSKDPPKEEKVEKDEASSDSDCSSKAETVGVSQIEETDHFQARTSGPTSLRLATAFAEGPNGRSEKVNILLDEGSMCSLVSTRLANSLQLTGRKTKFKLKGLFGNVKTLESALVKLNLISEDKTFAKKVSLKVVPDPTDGLKPINWEKYKEDWAHLKMLNCPELVVGKTVDIIIGSNYPTLLHSDYSIPGKGDDEPFARLSPFGWTIHGPVFKSEKQLDDAETEDTNCFVRSFFVSNPSEYIRKQELRFSNWLKENSGPFENVYFGKESNNHAASSRGFGFKKTEVESCHLLKEDDKELKDLVRQTLEVEKLPGDDDDEEVLSLDEQEALEILKKSRKKVDGKYQVSVLWKKGEPNLPNNFPYAYSRLLSLENSKKLASSENKEAYFSVFRSWKDKGYIHKVPPDQERDPEANYLAHMAVIRTDRTTSKVRPVLDGAARYKEKCLNDAVHAGPKLMNNLCVVLIRFMMDKIAVIADAAEMFLQVKMEPKDRKFHRILYRENKNDPLEEYEFERHTFGNRGSPCVAIFVIKEHAKDNISEYPRAAETVIESTIVDDNLDSVGTEEEAIKLIQDLKILYNGCGMQIRKFMSNSLKVLESVSPDERAKSIDLSHITTLTNENLPLVKTLGVVWLAEEDNFTFVFEMPDSNTNWTKRETLRTGHRVYDPLGWIVPFLILQRLQQQKFWHLSLGWDEKIPDNLLVDWLKWVGNIPLLEKIRKPRCLKGKVNESPKRQELHIFTDASEKAYAAVAYLVSYYSDSVRSSIVMARAKIAPMKRVTIPRLELMAAHIGVLLAKQVNKAFKLPQNFIYFWSDSRNVLCWLRTTTKNLKAFVANRVQIIHNNSKLANWKKVPTELNPADIASRGAMVEKLVDNSLWFDGPEFLRTQNWPEQENLVKSPEAEEEIRIFFVKDGYDKKEKDITQVDPEYHSDFRVYKCFIRCAYFWVMKHKKLATNRFEKCVEDKVFAHIFRGAQRASFRETISEIEKGGSCLKKNPLHPLQPRFDSTGTLRVYGRMELAKHLRFESRCPLILHSSHPLSTLIMRQIHENTLKHVGGVNHLLSEMNTKYWIVGARMLAKKVIRSCVRCKNLNAKESHQKMAPLPDFRILDSPDRLAPFSTIGIDCAGPFYTKQGRAKARSKRYMLMITCAQYRAVHIEMLYSLDTPSFLKGMSRFFSRRSRPKRIVSDNGKNFVGGNEEFKELLKLMEKSTELKDKYPDIEWKFNTPFCPHSGGLFERMIKSAKIAFYGIVGNAELNDEELHTTFTIVEGLLNSRPITYISDDPRDPEPLTPGHFLGVKNIADLAPVPEKISLKSRWHYIQKLMDDFWSRFVKECLSNLHKFPKWMTIRKNLAPGEVVIALEDKGRGLWPLGRITDVQKSRDGLVRTVSVKLPGNRVLTRPAHKFVPLLED